ncbi:hypothetical protein FISHEDRAFT_66809 [Fistulina hepatica ATCC 64428]|uniref:RAVE complex protein Rav1 C-terminal domain-containing protein n=1 Tax=Fistulina hepatica ATCC 64428 TaxID=1128425 RepID=A0A0D7A4K0_9AGAR|nr:hypothetical protein FISHEDRAFT_66809 [Fistulina hepatica ATCC 64428]
MLSLQQAILGQPTTGLQVLELADSTLLIYTSADTVIILDAQSFGLIRLLAFWEAFPGTLHSNDKISCISVDPGMKLVVAAMGCRIAAWSLSGVRDGKWRMHSSLSLSPSHIITALDNRSGLIAVGSQLGLAVYTLIMENDLPIWSLKWTVSTTTPALARFSPSLTCIATTSSRDHNVRTYSTTTGKLIQIVPHRRPLVNVIWRLTRDDVMLYTVTSDGTLRVFIPVLDTPHYLQLHASLDFFSSVPQQMFAPIQDSRVFCPDRTVIEKTFQRLTMGPRDLDDAKLRRIREIQEGGWDLFLRVLSDRSIVVSAIANIDRRPPTLLKKFNLQNSLPDALLEVPEHIYVVPSRDDSSLSLVTTSPVRTYRLSPLTFFDVPERLPVQSQLSEHFMHTQRTIVRFVRTPEGRGVCAIRQGGGGDVWRVEGADVATSTIITLATQWSGATFAVALDCGRHVVTYTASDSVLTLHSAMPFKLSIPPIIYLFSMPSTTGPHDSLYGITSRNSVIHIHVEGEDVPLALSIHCHHSLPMSEPHTMIRQVDPMAWGLDHPWTEHDVLLSVSTSGTLAFWVPEAATTHGWRCTGTVRTGRTGIIKTRCSSAKKTALITLSNDGQELTIWDSHESEFSSGLEYVTTYTEPIADLDWTATPDTQSILAVGFSHHIELLCEQRMSYFDDGPRWATCWRIEVDSLMPHSISDSIWLANGNLLVGAGHQMFIFSQAKHNNSSLNVKSNVMEEDLFQFVARINGPLQEYHPQTLLQCLLWDKVELVKDIIVNLARFLENGDNDYQPLPLERFLQKTQSGSRGQIATTRKKHTMLFNDPQPPSENEDDGFSRPVVIRLLDLLETRRLPHLTANEHESLLALIQTTLEIDEQRRALDPNGLRYLISMRSFYIFNNRVSSSCATPSGAANGSIPRKTGKRARLRYRDMIWAYHSESQDLLLGACLSACSGKMVWSDARALGVAIWLKNVDSLKSQIETIARNEYMAGDARDPTACSLFYFALGKVKLVHGLWRQAAWHKEHAAMLKFLSNDFTEPRWRTAALKNAYALLSKQRFEYAAAFFLLGGALKDAVAICIKQLGDFQLAIAIARIVEHSNEGQVLRDVLNNTVLPIAFQDGNRWLASWAFWLLRRRDLAVRILVTPLQDIANILDPRPTEIGDPHYDDPSLALLFSQLRSKTLQAAKGTSEISGRLEFNFVLQIARVFCKMGCHALALSLTRWWSFDRPTAIAPRHHHFDAINGVPKERTLPPSPTSRRSAFFLNTHRRQSTMMIDLDIESVPATRVGSPSKPTAPIQEKSGEGDLLARKAGLGSLMQTAKQDVTVPEFDINAFF